MKVANFVLALPIFACTGCASPGGQTFLTGLTGAAAGLAVGLAVDSGPHGRGRAQNVFAGISIGTLLGSGVGFLIEQKTSRPSPAITDTKSLPRENPKPSDLQDSGLVPPLVNGKFVDDQIRGNIFVPGHFEYQIKEATKPKERDPRTELAE